MEGKIFGIPLIIILLALLIALLVDLPMALFHTVTEKDLNSMNRELMNHSVQLETLRQVVVATPTPASPSATPVPTKVYYVPAATTVPVK